ncbi:MAG: FUN14 domain-containing protein [Planctomycetota bacterium]
METNEEQTPPEPKPTQVSLKDMPTWKKILVFAAIGFIACGLALIPFDTSSSDLSTQQVSQETTQGGGAIPSGASGLVGEGSTFAPESTGTGSDGSAAGASAESGGGDLSPAFLRLGFSFFVGFAVGLAFRSLLRLALIFVGLQLLVLFGLASMEWIQIDTEAMKTSFDGMTGRVGEQFESFRSFITGSLPQASLGGLGMVAGFKKN